MPTLAARGLIWSLYLTLGCCPMLASQVGGHAFSAADSGWNRLVTNSPFGFEPPKPSGSLAESWAFLGYIEEDDQWLVCVSHTDKSGRNRSTWLSVGQVVDELTVLGLKEDTLELLVQYSGLVAKLPLKKARIQAIKLPEPAPNLSPEEQEDKVRLANIAAELKVRRALRQEGSQPADVEQSSRR